MSKYPYIDKLASMNDIDNLKKEMYQVLKIVRNYSNELHTAFSERASKVVNEEKMKLKYIENKINSIK